MIVAAALIAMALALQPSQAPQEPRSTKGGGTEKTSTTEHSDKSKEPAQISKQSSLATSQPASTANQANTDHEAENIKIQAWIEIFTGVLAGVGVLQFMVMFLTWLVYRRQAREMRRQRHEMRRQRHVMFRQWKAMHEQIGQMAAQTTVLERSVAVAKESADAARDSVEIVVNKERARLRVEPQQLSLPETEPSPFFCVTYRVRLIGPTDASIVRAECFARLTDSQTPPTVDGPFPWPIDIPQWFTQADSGTDHYRPIWTTQDFNNVSSEDITGLRSGMCFIHFWGFINYQDIFQRPHTHRFRYLWKLNEIHFGSSPRSGHWRKYGSDQDNSDD